MNKKQIASIERIMDELYKRSEKLEEREMKARETGNNERLERALARQREVIAQYDIAWRLIEAMGYYPECNCDGTYPTYKLRKRGI